MKRDRRFSHAASDRRKNPPRVNESSLSVSISPRRTHAGMSAKSQHKITKPFLVRDYVACGIKVTTL